ncbi:DUF4180 domain-containing protein [Chitinophaga sp. CF118]|uniref:DUF4180 domain-containing protein n=1 Tax=Chitinophaga sp. CF118 TaxID=1884367 RepID=UPI000B7C88B4|nr:DUF4180 domain-containing protein [Chitinophaga sp. CF118]
MNIEIHKIGDIQIAEVISEEVLIKNQEDALDFIVDLYYQDFEKIIIHEKNITPDFFNLETGIAGEVLQKFSNYKIQLFIIGEFTKYPGKSLKAFIYESNKGQRFNFLDSVELAVEKMSK